ncbi:cytochrome c family protein [uncultured Thioclava sp.]|jgi:cytochrome c|uniref:Cytochrome c family protein n=1 Tax=Thioclava arctica TaxID=3238301 RepID=A0ABV3TH09_9RHOB|nr:cytochrome c family protein [uncultured Thioclava sp.]
MFNTMTLTKLAGALLGALLFFLLMAWASSALYHVGESEDHSGGEHEAAAAGTMMSAAPGDLLATEGDAAAETETKAEETIVLGDGDAGKGAKVFGKCKACHSVEGKNGVGPHLDGVINRAVGSVADFNYSDAMKSHGGEWTLEAINAYLANPKEYVPGNKMSFAGLKKAEDRNDVIAYLQEHTQ